MLGFILCGLMIGDAAPNTTPPRPTHDAVANLARSYRIQIYNQYRTQRPVYDELISQSFEVLERARKFDHAATEQTEFLTWFEQAIDGTTSEVDGLPVPLTYARGSSYFETVPTSNVQTETPVETTPTPPTTVESTETQATPPATDAEVAAPSKFLGAIGNLILGSGDTQTTSPQTDTVGSTDGLLPQDVEEQFSAVEASLAELNQANEELEKSFAEIEQDAKAGQADAQAELAKIDEELGKLKKLSYDDAKLFLVRITLTGAANDLAGAVAGDTSPDAKPTQDLLRKIRRQIAGKAFTGKPSQRRELIEQIDGLLNGQTK